MNNVSYGVHPYLILISPSFLGKNWLVLSLRAVSVTTQASVINASVSEWIITNYPAHLVPRPTRPLTDSPPSAPRQHIHVRRWSAGDALLLPNSGPRSFKSLMSKDLPLGSCSVLKPDTDTYLRHRGSRKNTTFFFFFCFGYAKPTSL